jgi:hypothetical protein
MALFVRHLFTELEGMGEGPWFQDKETNPNKGHTGTARRQAQLPVHCR